MSDGNHDALAPLVILGLECEVVADRAAGILQQAGEGADAQLRDDAANLRQMVAEWEDAIAVIRMEVPAEDQALFVGDLTARPHWRDGENFLARLPGLLENGGDQIPNVAALYVCGCRASFEKLLGEINAALEVRDRLRDASGLAPQ